MTSKEIQDYVYAFFINKGMPTISVCAMMGNITGESSWNVDAIEGNTGIGFGLCQWSFSRRTQLEAYGTSLKHQCEFLWSELTGENLDETGAEPQWYPDPHDSVDNGEGFYFELKDFMDGKGSIDVLTKAFCYCWERPAYETNHLTSTRIPSAIDFYETYNGNPPPDVPDLPDNPDNPDEPSGTSYAKRSGYKFILFKQEGRKSNWRSRILSKR